MISVLIKYPTRNIKTSYIKKIGIIQLYWISQGLALIFWDVDWYRCELNERTYDRILPTELVKLVA